jgi:hypothetical protein
VKLTRRDLLVWGAGATAGLFFTPVPWKLLDDVSIWSQNWPWIPQPSHGPIEVKSSFCTLCPNGCGMKVRMAAAWPVSVMGVSHHPVSRGALCPLGFAAHQLNWHPRRLHTVRHHQSTSSWSEASAAFAQACNEGPIAIIDGYSGRAASSVFETFAQKRGAYRVVLSPAAQTLTPYEAWSGVPAAALGYDLENTDTIVSFGAPLLEGWAIPGRFTRLWAERAAGLADPELRLIQIDAAFSRTAARAWQWIPVPPGTEAALAEGVARVLLEEYLVSARVPMPPRTLAQAADQTGLGIAAIRDLARAIISRPPVLAIANDGNPAIAALNVVLGAVGARGGVVRRSKPVLPGIRSDAVIGKMRAVLVDSTVPWDFAPQTDAEVFRFAAWDGGSSQADWLLPAPGFLEELTDVPTAPTSAIETYAVAPGLVKPAPDVQSAAQFLSSIDPALIPVEKIIHARCAEFFRQRIGTLHRQEAMPVARFASLQKLEEELWQGAVWTGELPRSGGLHCELKEWPADLDGAHTADPSSPWRVPVLPSLASKLFQESNLFDPPERRNA